MPELPEVEVVARALDRLVSRRRIVASELLRPRLAPDTTPDEFARHLDGASVNFVHRRGKHILFDLDNGRTLITHLRMSGKFRLLGRAAANPKFTHAVFHFTDIDRLVFEDQRHFGLMKIVESARLHETKEIRKLAPEPLGEDFSYEHFRTVLQASKRALKEVLLDQTKVCGLGNIYASEAMFLARVDPRIRAHRLSKPKTLALFTSIRQVLTDALELGSTIPVIPDNIGGSIYGTGSGWTWSVYDRDGQPCGECSSPITRIVQAGRSSYFCRQCQKK